MTTLLCLTVTAVLLLTMVIAIDVREEFRQEEIRRKKQHLQLEKERLSRSTRGMI